jgi:hypothetical protein
MRRERLDGRLELSDVRTVAGMDVRGDRDRTVSRLNGRKPDNAKLVALVLGVASFRNGVALIRGLDVGRDVRDVEHESLGRDLEFVKHAPHDLRADTVARCPRLKVSRARWKASARRRRRIRRGRRR